MSSEATAPEADSLTPDRVQEMRRAIHSHLQSNNVYGEIRDIINAYAADHVDFNPNNPEDIMTVIKERGVVQDLLGKMQSAQQSKKVGASAVSHVGMLSRRALSEMKPGGKYLHVRLLGGRAFLDNIDGNPQVLKRQQMTVAIQFGHQRFRATPKPCTCDPEFDDDFLVHLTDELTAQRRSNASAAHGGASFMSASDDDLLSLSIPMHILVLKEDMSFRSCRVVGENVVEWRKVLKTGFLSMTIEMSGQNPGVPSGIIELQLELIPGFRRHTEEDINVQLQTEKSHQTASDREFLIYARRWWNEFHSIRQAHSDRRVKVFASTTSGRMVPVTHFVSVVQPDRVLDTPEDAARFVALIGSETREDLTQEVITGAATPSPDQWASVFSFLSRRRGDAPNHAALLCSLLLGFGLDAYCTVGATRNGDTHMWVTTRQKTGPYQYQPSYWEPSSGERFDPTGAHRYMSIGCLFNHCSFYANVMEGDSAVSCDFDLDNEAKWKSLNPLKLRLVPKLPLPPILWVDLNARALEVDLEERLVRAITEYRETVGNPTYWDGPLAFVMNQALVSYERQRVAGGGTGGDTMQYFQSCVKGKIGEGRTFKAFPINVTHVDERKILAAVSSNATGKEILDLTADDLALCLRVRIFPFPEGVFSAWIMLGARYQSLPTQ